MPSGWHALRLLLGRATQVQLRHDAGNCSPARSADSCLGSDACWCFCARRETPTSCDFAVPSPPLLPSFWHSICPLSHTTLACASRREPFFTQRLGPKRCGHGDVSIPIH